MPLPFEQSHSFFKGEKEKKRGGGGRGGGEEQP